MNLSLHLNETFKQTLKPVCVVRLTTSQWSDERGIYEKRQIRYIQKKSSGFNFLAEDVSCIGANEVFPLITNLHECEDGVYEVITCNERSDWETPHIIEEYDYKLIPYETVLPI